MNDEKSTGFIFAFGCCCWRSWRITIDVKDVKDVPTILKTFCGETALARWWGRQQIGKLFAVYKCYPESS
jgi:hypothetical protein